MFKGDIYKNEKNGDLRCSPEPIQNTTFSILNCNYRHASGSRKRKADAEHDSAPPKKRTKMIPISEFRENLEKIVIGHKRKTMKPRDLKYFVRHWRLNADETTAFYKYYDDTDVVPMGELSKNDSIGNVQFCNFMTVLLTGQTVFA